MHARWFTQHDQRRFARLCCMHILVAASCCNVQLLFFTSSLTLSVGQQNESVQLEHRHETVKLQTYVGAEGKEVI